MSSADSKEMIVETYPFEGSHIKDWKRTKKITRDGQTYRVFRNAVIDREAIVVDDEMVHPGGALVYGLHKDEEGGVMVMFTPRFYYDANDGAMYDQHWGDTLVHIYGVPAWIAYDEVMENSFVVEEGHSLDEVKTALDGLGIELVQLEGQL